LAKLEAKVEWHVFFGRVYFETVSSKLC